MPSLAATQTAGLKKLGFSLSDSKNEPLHPARILSELSGTDRATFFQRAHRFSRLLKQQPNLVSDDDIHELLGEEVDPAKIRSFVSHPSAPSSAAPVVSDGQTGHSEDDRATTDRATASETTEEGKRLRKKANSALNARLFALQRMLEEVEAAIAGVVAAPGQTNRLSELEQMQQSIDAFRTAIGWPRDPALPLPTIDPEIFRDLLLDPTWTPDDAPHRR